MNKDEVTQLIEKLLDGPDEDIIKEATIASRQMNYAIEAGTVTDEDDIKFWVGLRDLLDSLRDKK